MRNCLLRLINECKSMRMLKQIHTQIITSPSFPEADRYFLTTRLLFFYALSNYRCLPYAVTIFQHIHNPNLFAYNAMIRAYVSTLSSEHEPYSCPSVILYQQMLHSRIWPNKLTFPFLIKECSKRLDRNTGKAIYGHATKFGFNFDVYVQNSLINFYSECGMLDDAFKVFDEMFNKDIVSWNSVIVGCLRNGEVELALDLFGTTEKRSIYTWNSVITGLVQAGRSKEALDVFQEMQLMDDLQARPDKITVASVLSACASLGAINHGNWVHGHLKKSGLEFDVVIGTALIDMYGKCGCVDRAVEVFKELPNKDVLAWTVMLSVFALHGYGQEALELLEEMDMQGVKPNHVTFVGILSACAHSGLTAEGLRCFDAMSRVYAIEPQVYHYACKVDMLSRAAHFDEAEEVIRTMPMEPDAFVWGALLGGCQLHGNTELGEDVATKLINLDPLNHAFYINLCDIYAKGGRSNDVKRVRNSMQEKGIKKDIPGCSMIEVDGVVREFSVGGSTQVMMPEIIWLLNRLVSHMKVDHDANNI